MARKTLLTEGELRRFMKLATLNPINDNRLHEMGYQEPDSVDEEMAGPEELEKFAADDLGDDSLEGDEEAAADELDAEMEMEPEMDIDADAEGEMSLSDEEAEAIIDLADRLRAAMGDEEVAPVEDEEEIEVAADLEGPEGGEELELDAEEEVPAMRDLYEDEDAVVNEVAKRVARRLQAKDSQAKVVDQLAERILARLTK